LRAGVVWLGGRARRRHLFGLFLLFFSLFLRASGSLRLSTT